MQEKIDWRTTIYWEALNFAAERGTGAALERQRDAIGKGKGPTMI